MNEVILAGFWRRCIFSEKARYRDQFESPSGSSWSLRRVSLQAPASLGDFQKPRVSDLETCGPLRLLDRRRRITVFLVRVRGFWRFTDAAVPILIVYPGSLG